MAVARRMRQRHTRAAKAAVRPEPQQRRRRRMYPLDSVQQYGDAIENFKIGCCTAVAPVPQQCTRHSSAARPTAAQPAPQQRSQTRSSAPQHKDLTSAQAIFESYPMQKSLGRLLFMYGWPCTFLVPYVGEPIFKEWLSQHIGRLLVQARR